MKPYQQVAIAECGEALVPIPLEQLSRVFPHPYQMLGAPYGDKSPFYVRQGVCDRLLVAQALLQQSHPQWKIQIFDAYRPIAVQQFMVEHTFLEVVQARGWNLAQLTQAQRQSALEQVYEFWAVPSLDPAMPPPHSTGAAVDVTLVDGSGQPVDMGSPIDELSARSYPDHFSASQNPVEQTYDQNRQLLHRIMTEAGFARHPREWWHFSFGDQLWAWLMNQTCSDIGVIARYGVAQ